MRRQPQDEGALAAGAEDRGGEIARALAELHDLAEAVAAAWTSPKNGIELVEEQRR